MALIEFDDLLASLVIEDRGGDAYAAPNIPMPYHRIFGGQLLAQAVMIATASGAGTDGAPDKAVKSMHVAFPRAGDLAKPVDYRLERPQDGRAFATRKLSGDQDGKSIFEALLSLHVIEDGRVHQLDAPEAATPERATATALGMIPWETRVVDAVDLESREVGPPRYAFWMKTPPLEDTPALHQALLAHATDLTLIGTALRPHAGLSEADSGEKLATAVTTHTLWFHRAFRVDDWLLVAQESPSLAGARGFGTGRVFTRRGELVASFAQESLIRER